MTRLTILLSLSASVVFVCAACNNLPGHPGPNSEVISPDQILDFNILYAQNCAGCHGAAGSGGAGNALRDPVFLAIADDSAIRNATANGMRGTAMPAFAQSAGGMLTDKQIDALVSGIRSWAPSSDLHGTTPPPYIAKTAGNAQRGAEVYQTFCSGCHGPNGTGGDKASSIVDGSYLALTSDQYLRITVIAGRPELGAPDWRGNVPGKPMSDQEVTDVVAWLAARRAAIPGQPYPDSKNAQYQEHHNVD
ncbi:MAG: cytochrome c oxidase cbb3-type subunit [Acidobacteriaceae bacterium]|jgi:cytochrome c oxidase cbb3-type subunit 3|nr:cytochrome c oxidase cbb3-type subunit [Acidobacteriaceae bacterium]